MKKILSPAQARALARPVMKKILSPVQARALVSRVGWLMMQRGYCAYSRDMTMLISPAGYLYTAVPCSRHW